MKKIILIIFMFIITGCFNYTEINDLKLVNGIYIDYKDNVYNLKFDTDKTIEVTGDSITDAFRNFDESISKRAYYAHLKILILSSEIITNHFDEVIKYFLRNNEIRNNFYLVISDNIDDIKSDYIKDIITNNNDVITSCLFKNVLTTYLDKKKIFIPVISDNKIIGSIIKTKDMTKTLNIDDTRLYKLIKNKNPNTVYKNINIYHSKIKKYKNSLYISLDAELKENKDINVKKELEEDLERLLNTNIILTLDINRKGQILNE